MRKWTKSACVVVALGIMSLLAVAGSRGPGHAAQANISIASSTQTASAVQPGAILMTVTAAPLAAAPLAAASAPTWVVRPGETLSSVASALGLRGGWQALYAANRRGIGADPNVIRPGTTLAVPGKGAPLRYAVQPGDSLSGIAAALAMDRGWQALYAANRQVIGTDPGLIRPGTVLVAPPSAATQGSFASNGHPVSTGSPRPAPGGGIAATSVLPAWLKGALLAAALLTLLAFAAEPTLVLARRRRRPGGAARPGVLAPVPSRGQRACEQRAAAKIPRIVQAEHERLIVTYCVSDDTVYLLTPPGEDPRSVLRAARLVLPEDTYEELAGHLGVSSGWRVD